jgi:tripartite-type tricarboxylate transporter receptor subunit TctC
MMRALALAAAIVASAFVNAAEPYPAKVIRMIVPYSPGGTGDNIGRAVGAKLGELLGQQVIIDNRPGAGGNIGAEAAVRAAPDGYTVVMAATSLASNPALQRKMPFDPLKNLVPVSGCCEVPMIVVVHPSLPMKNIKEFVAYAKAYPGKLTYASSGIGTSSHLAAELFRVQTGVDMLHAPYKTDALAMPDLLSGQVPVMFMFQTAALPQVRAGKLRALAVSTAQRSPLAPELPTVAEAGVPGYEFSGWFGIFAPAATPTEIVNKLAAALVRAVQSPDLRERLSQQGFMPVASGPEQFAAFFRREVAKWARVVKEGGLQPQD